MYNACYAILCFIYSIRVFIPLIKTSFFKLTHLHANAQGERNFHIFYQLMAAGTDAQLSALGIRRAAAGYTYTSAGNAIKVSSVDDKKDFRQYHRC